jgi:predicted amidohydrolase YtcJ
MVNSISGSSVPTADLVFVNGKVVTVNSKDEVTEALAVRGKRILRVGSGQVVDTAIGPATKIIDLKGRTLLPGFVENHIHMTNSPQRHWVDCSYAACPSIADIRDKISARARQTKAGEWILGRGFQSVRLAERRNPNRFDLDQVSSENPVGLANREGMGWTFNTLGLRRIGVQDDTPDPPGGPMERDAQGRPLGPMWDNTREIFIKPNLPPYTLDDLVEGYRWITAELNRNGVTTAFEAAIRNRFETVAWRKLVEKSSPTLRVVMGPYPVNGEEWNGNGTAGKIYDTGFATGFGDEWMKLGALQIGIDGGVIGQTAALFEPYSNDPKKNWRGSFRMGQEVANSMMIRAQQNDWQVGLIAHGDHGIARALDAIEHGRTQAPGRELRHRLEHAYLWNTKVMDRMGELGVIWNTQPVLMEIMGRAGALCFSIQIAHRPRRDYLRRLRLAGGFVQSADRHRHPGQSSLRPRGKRRSAESRRTAERAASDSRLHLQRRLLRVRGIRKGFPRSGKARRLRRAVRRYLRRGTGKNPRYQSGFDLRWREDCLRQRRNGPNQMKEQAR